MPEIKEEEYEKEKLAEIDKQIEALRKEKIEKEKKLAEEEVVKEEPVIPNVISQPEIDYHVIHAEYIPPDPLAEVTGIYIEWIDNRYHINGIHGIPNGNRIIVRKLSDIDTLIFNLEYAKKSFNQPEMISTKKSK